MSARQEQQHALVSAEEADRQRLLQGRWPRRGLRQLLLRQALAALASASATFQVSSMSPTSASSAKTANTAAWVVSAAEFGNVKDFWVSRPLAPSWAAKERGAVRSRQRLRQERWLPRPLALALAPQG